MEQACDSGKYGCELFLDLEMAFDTVNYHILLKKLNHYGKEKLQTTVFVHF